MYLLNSRMAKRRISRVALYSCHRVSYLHMLHCWPTSLHVYTWMDAIFCILLSKILCSDAGTQMHFQLRAPQPKNKRHVLKSGCDSNDSAECFLNVPFCVYQGAIRTQYSKLSYSKTLDPPLLIVTTVLILRATGVLWSSCCKLSELSFTSRCL